MEWERLEQSRTLENYNNLLAACLSVGLCEYGYTSFQRPRKFFWEAHRQFCLRR